MKEGFDNLPKVPEFIWISCKVIYSYSLDFHLWDITKLKCLNGVGDRDIKKITSGDLCETSEFALNTLVVFFSKDMKFDFCSPSGKCLALCYSIILLLIIFMTTREGLRSNFRAALEDVSWCFLIHRCYTQQRQRGWTHPSGEQENSAWFLLTFINPFLIKSTQNSWKSRGKWKMISKNKTKFPLVVNPRQGFKLIPVATGSGPAGNIDPLIFPSLCLPFSSQNKVLCSSTLTKEIGSGTGGIILPVQGPLILTKICSKWDIYTNQYTLKCMGAKASQAELVL